MVPADLCDFDFIHGQVILPFDRQHCSKDYHCTLGSVIEMLHTTSYYL